MNLIFDVHLNPQVLLAEQFSYCRCDFLIPDHQNVVAKRKKNYKFYIQLIVKPHFGTWILLFGQLLQAFIRFCQFLKSKGCLEKAKIPKFDSITKDLKIVYEGEFNVYLLWHFWEKLIFAIVAQSTVVTSVDILTTLTTLDKSSTA